MSVAPGTTVAVEVTARPRSEAAEKTLIRLFSKDPVIARGHRAMERKRPSWQLKRRGGRLWHHQMKSQTAVELTPGSRYTIRATLDVLRDLESVKRYVKVAAAK